MPADIVRFDNFELDLGRYELRRGARVVKLEKNPMELLILLVENQGRLVMREEIIQRLWGDNVFVDTRHGINTAVHKLRTALRDDSEQPRILETVIGKGYRLVATVVAELADEPSADAILAAPATEEVASTKAKEPSPITFWSRKLTRWTARAIALAACLVLILWLIPSNLRDRLLGRPSPIQSLAVLPFDNLSGDSSKDYFADGFTEELTTDLAEHAGIRVVSRTSAMRYKTTRKPLPEIARELKVDAIVEGSVVISDQQVRITAQLIQASNDQHLWAHSYDGDRKDLLPIQNEIAATIAGFIREKKEARDEGTVRAASIHPRFTPATYELFLECNGLRKTGSKEGVSHAAQCYQHILALDPNSAAAYAGLASCFLAVDPSKAGPSIVESIKLDPSLEEAHTASANFKMIYERDLAGAGKEFRTALALNPSYAEAHSNYAMLLLATGRATDAVAEARIARELDPFSASAAMYYGMTLFMARQYDRAIEEEKASLDLDPHHDRAHYWWGYAYEQKGMYKEAIMEYEKVPEDTRGELLAARGRSLWLEGDSENATEVNQRIEHFPANDFVWPYDGALFYAASGDKDRAFQWLEKDLKERDGWLLLLNVDPRLAPLRSDPRFPDLVKRVGLPVS